MTQAVFLVLAEKAGSFKFKPQDSAGGVVVYRGDAFYVCECAWRTEKASAVA